MISRRDIQSIHQLRTKHYDFSARPYGLVGFRHGAYRARAVKLLGLRRGDFVVELGCATGLNFSMILDEIGSEGRLIGVDLTRQMLAGARDRVEQSGWRNVELIRSEMVGYEFPDGVNRVLSTGALGFVPEYELVIEAASEALTPGGRLVILDLKFPERWPSWLFQLFLRAGRPFGAPRDYVATRPWEAVERYFQETVFEQKYAGLVYTSSGTARSLAA